MSAEGLEGIIAEICTKISTLNRREAEINRNTTSEVDVVEKDVLLRRIRSERGELNKELAECSSQKAMLDNNVEAAEDFLQESKFLPFTQEYFQLNQLAYGP